MHLIFLVLFAVFYTTIVLILFPVQALLLISILSVVLLLVLPGVILLSILKIKTNSFWEAITLTIGLSISLVMLVGLGVNILLPVFGVTNPLAKMPLLISLNLFIIVLFVFSFYQHRQDIFKLSIWVKFYRKIRIYTRSFRRRGKRKINGVEIVLGLALFIFPILSILGAVSLNNSGSNVFTMILLGGIGLFVVTITVLKDKVAQGFYPASIFSIGLALLLMTSMRGWYLFGHDVQFEYYIFQLTKQNQFWNIDFYKDAYNACLSITILPTILSNFLRFNDIYIYKVVYQIIFAFCPVVIYLFLKKYTTPYLAFIASFYFLTFPTYLNDMPMLNRQEIALLFFSLLLYVLFRKREVKGKYVVLSLLSFGMVVSHYSTAYLTVFLLSITYFGYLFLKVRWTQRIIGKYTGRYLLFKKANRAVKKQHISLTIVVLLVTLTLIWNGLLTKTSNDLVDTLTKAVVNVGNILKEENKSVDIAYSLFFSYQIDDRQYLDNYLKTTLDKSKEESVQDLYDPATYESYRPEIVKNDVLAPTHLGSVLANMSVNVFQFNYISRQFFAKFIQILIVVGLIAILYIKTKSKYDVEYIIASLAGVLLIALMVVLPGISLSYGLLRLFQQMLVILSLPMVLGSLLIFRQIGEAKSLYLVGIVAVLFFLNLSGYISEATGGYYSQSNLRNKGIYYDAYYVHGTEVASIKWLSDFMAEDYTVQADPITRDKLLTYGNIFTMDGNFPQIIRKAAYVYAGYFNTSGNTVVSVDRSIIIKFPFPFLDENKDVIYHNGSSRIYF